MQKLMLVLAAVLSLSACRKTQTGSADPIEAYLQAQLPAAEYERLDFATVTRGADPVSGRSIVRVGLKQSNPLHDFVILSVSATGQFLEGRIVHVDGGISVQNNKPSFNGNIRYTDLHGCLLFNSAIVNGFVKALHQQSVTVNSAGNVRLNYECADCTLPEVIVSSSYNNGGYDWTAFWNLYFFFADWPPPPMAPIDYLSGGGGGGGGYSGPAVVTPDKEVAESKTPINPKKYTDCFGTVPDAGSTCTMTISSDIPVDSDPNTFFNWSENSPGHVFIEMYKLGANGGLISQNFGFYPNTDFKAASGLDVSSKIVDNAYHEYNARYTISVSPAQLQAAINMVNSLSGHSYNIASYNCTDFALAVFNAGGGNLSIPKYQIPGYIISGGSNTPQGLYNKLQDMSIGGTAGIQTNANKAYGGSSHGPCN